MSILVMSQFFKVPFGSSNRKMVAIRLADYADDEGRGIWPSVETIAEQCEIAPRTVQRILKDFVTEGILILKQQGGGRKTSRYDFDLQRVQSMKEQPVSDKNAATALKNLASDEGCHGDTGDNNDLRGDTVSPLGRHHVTAGVTPCHPNRNRTTTEPSETVNQRESAQARDEDGEEKEALTGQPDAVGETAPEDQTGTAAFEKRVMRFCNGTGFAAGPWRDWDTSSPGYIAKQFAALTVEDRKAAETWRDAYLRDIASRRKKPVPVGVFIRDRLWTGLDTALLERDAKAREQNLPAAKRAVPDDWANAWGPVFNGFLIAQLLKGRHDGRDGEGVPVMRTHVAAAYPVYENMLRFAEQRHGAPITKPWHALKDAMVFVEQGDAVAGWREAFRQREWVWPAAFNAEKGVWLPKGGPDALDAFEQAVREAAQANQPEHDTEKRDHASAASRRSEREAVNEYSNEDGGDDA